MRREARIPPHPSGPIRVSGLKKALFGLLVGVAGVHIICFFLNFLYQSRVPPQGRLVRYLLPQEDCPPDSAGYRAPACLKPSFHEGPYLTSSLGFWGPEIEREKPENVVRIVCLGGSTTQGLQDRSPSESWPDGLREGAQQWRLSKKVEVLNAGVQSYASRDDLYTLEVNALPVHPDLVIIYSGWNDFKGHQFTREQAEGIQRYYRTGDPRHLIELGTWYARHIKDFERKRNELEEFNHARLALLRSDPDYHPALERVADFVGDRFEFYNYLRGLAWKTRHEIDRWDGGLRDRSLFDEDFVPEPFIANLRRMVALARASNATAVLCTLPHGFGFGARLSARDTGVGILDGNDWFHYQTKVANPWIRRIAKETGAVLVDLDERLDSDLRRKFFRETDGLHARGEGYLYFGSLVAEGVAPLVKTLESDKE